MAFRDLWEITKTLVTLTEDIKKSREEIKTLSTQVNTLATQLMKINIKFEAFSEQEFKNFTEQEMLKERYSPRLKRMNEKSLCKR